MRNKMYTNQKGVSYYKLYGRYFSNTGFLEVEISKEEYETEVSKAMEEIGK
jgi:hypothetical protein